MSPIRLCNFMLTIHAVSHRAGDADLTLAEKWKEAWTKLLPMITRFRTMKFEDINDDEKQATSDIALKCLTRFHDLDGIKADSYKQWKEAFDPETSRIPDALVKEVARFAPQKALSQFYRIRRLRELKSSRNSTKGKEALAEEDDDDAAKAGSDVEEDSDDDVKEGSNGDVEKTATTTPEQAATMARKPVAKMTETPVA